MDLLKVVSRGRVMSRHSFLHPRTFSQLAAPTNNRSSWKARSRAPTHHPIQSAQQFLAPTPPPPPLKGMLLFSTRSLNHYSTNTPAPVKDIHDSDGTGSSKESGSECSSAEETSSSSMSQTGEPLPSEQEQSEWDRKVDKLYKEIELEVLAYEPSVLDSYQWFVITAASHLGIQMGKCWSPLKSNKLRWPLLKSAFVHKKHVVHYEVRTYHRFMTFHKLTSSTADTFLEYIERNLPEGVGLKVTRVEAKALPQYLQQSQQQQQLQ